MNSRITEDAIEPKSGRIDQACQKYGLGRGTMRQVAENAGAIIRIGKCLLINYSKVDEYLDAISGNE